MADRTVRSVAWRQYDPTHVEVVFDDGVVDTVTGTHADAARMAEAAGLRPAHAPLGMVRWSRDQPTKDGRTAKRIGPWLSS